MQRRQSLIAGRDAAGARLFEVVQKLSDAVGRQVAGAQPVDRGLGRGGDERNEQRQRIAIALPRVLGEMTFAHQVLKQEAAHPGTQ